MKGKKECECKPIDMVFDGFGCWIEGIGINGEHWRCSKCGRQYYYSIAKPDDLKIETHKKRVISKEAQILESGA